MSNIKMLCAYLSKADDSMGIVIGRDKYSHLTTKSDLSPSLRILQTDLEMLLHLGDVVIHDVHRDLQLAVTWGKVQLPETEREEVKTNTTCIISLSEQQVACLSTIKTIRVPWYEIGLIGDRGELVYGGAVLLSGSQEGLGGVEGRDREREEARRLGGPSGSWWTGLHRTSRSRGLSHLFQPAEHKLRGRKEGISLVLNMTNRFDKYGGKVQLDKFLTFMLTDARRSEGVNLRWGLGEE